MNPWRVPVARVPGTIVKMLNNIDLYKILVIGRYFDGNCEEYRPMSGGLSIFERKSESFTDMNSLGRTVPIHFQIRQNMRKVSGFIFGTISFFFCFGACKRSDELDEKRKKRSSFITRFHSSNNIYNYICGYRKSFPGTASEEQKSHRDP